MTLCGSVEKVKFEKARQQQLELHQLEVQTLQSDLKDLSSAGKEADILIKYITVVSVLLIHWSNTHLYYIVIL